MTLLGTSVADAPALAALHAAAFPPAEAWGADAMALMLEMPGAYGLWQPGTGLGQPGTGLGAGLVLARAVAGEAEILTLAVVPGARRRGLGAALLAAALQGAVLRGAVVVFLEVAAGNATALALYRAAGFAGVGRRVRYYADGDDALVLRRDLSLS